MIGMRSRGPHARRDDGVTLVLAALSMVAILLVVAIVIDLGATRADRRRSQLAADNAAMSAGFTLNGSDPEGACEAAFAYLELTLETTAFVGDPCSNLAGVCTDSSAKEVRRTSGDFSVLIQYPVPNDSHLMKKTSTIGATEQPINTTLDGVGCRRLGVEVITTHSSLFGGIGGAEDRTSRSHAVVLETDDPIAVKPPAFLMLERTDCGVLGNSVNGAGNLGIIVEADETDPGLIHSDSYATTNCSGNTSNAYAIYGSPLSGGDPSIRVLDGPNGDKGTIRGVATNGKVGATYPGGLSVEPTVSPDLVSRSAVDEKYNSGTSKAITDAHDDAGDQVSATTSPPGGHAVADCDGNLTQTAPPSDSLFVDCATFDRTTSFSGFDRVVFSDAIELRGDNVLTFAGVETVVVRGALSLPKGKAILPDVEDLFVGGGVSVTNQSALAVNSTTESSCAAREGFTNGSPNWTNTTRFVVFGGAPAFDSSGTIAMCQTTLYLAGPKARASEDYTIQQLDSGGTCSTKYPCPKVSGNPITGAQFYFSGGTVNWSAPNQSEEPIVAPALQGLEDLAFWTEGAGTSEIRAGATVLPTGVLFAPNSNYEIRSPATGAPRDAQFIARKLFLFQGTLRMKPDDRNSVNIPVYSYNLIR